MAGVREGQERRDRWWGRGRCTIQSLPPVASEFIYLGQELFPLPGIAICYIVPAPIAFQDTNLNLH